MAETVKVTARRSVQLPFVDAFLWLIRIAALVALFWGAFRSLSGRGLVTLSSAQWRDNVVSGLSIGSVYALIALGYTMVYGVLRFINFAHGEVFMSGTMVGYFVAQALSGTGLWDGNMIFLALLIVLLSSMATATLIAMLLERVAYRPLRGKPRLIPFITAIGASFFLQYTFARLMGINVDRTIVLVFGIGGAMAGIAAFLFALAQREEERRDPSHGPPDAEDQDDRPVHVDPHQPGEGVLEEEGGSDGRDERDEPRLAPEGAVRYPLQQHRDQRCCGHARKQHDEQRQEDHVAVPQTSPR